MSKKSLIDAIEIKNPCPENWDQMAGGEKVRFCSHCASSVNNLSALTRKQALRLVRESGGGICARYVVDPADGTPVFAGQKLYRLTRRAALAAGVLGATLAVSTLSLAQGKPVLRNAAGEISQEAENSRKDKSESAAGIFGTVTDANGAVVPQTRVTLTNLKTEENTITTADREGFYKFENVAAGKYKLLFQYEQFKGLKDFSVEIEVAAGKETALNAVMEPAEITVTVGEIAVVEYKTPLFRAVSDNAFEEVETLIVRGANVNERDENYNRITPLFIAVENGSAALAETLLNFGAKINVRDDLRQTPLMRLDEDASVELVRLLLKHGARVNLTDRAGNTPLILAARAVTAEVLQVLIRHGAPVNARNAAGRTALMEAADADNFENVRALLVAGANANFKDEDGETAFELTTDKRIRKLLTAFGAGTNAAENR